MAAQTVYKDLRYDFTEAELHELSVDLANNTKELRRVTEEKSKANSNYNKTINAIKETCNDLSVKVSDGYVYRPTECEVEYHKPSQGTKTITRKDNGETFTEAMDEDDWNLFNQL